MIRLANQIVSVCAWLTNFQPVLIPLPIDLSTEDEVDTYFKNISDDSDYDADSEMSDQNDELIASYVISLVLYFCCFLLTFTLF